MHPSLESSFQDGCWKRAKVGRHVGNLQIGDLAQVAARLYPKPCRTYSARTASAGEIELALKAGTNAAMSAARARAIVAIVTITGL
jgi:hypothetical protein